MRRAPALVLGVVLLGGCGSATPRGEPGAVQQPAGAVRPPARPPTRCGGPPLTARFYDVGQAMAVLVELPDGRRILVDAGEHAERAGCGTPCRQWSEHLLDELAQDLAGRAIDMLWITHQHSDHLGGVPAVLGRHAANHYVDNGTRLAAPVVRAAREAAALRGTPVTIVDPSHRSSPLPSSASVTITAVVPEAWPGGCDRHINDCSIGLRIDYCSSSVLFTGDAEEKEEAALPIDRPVTLLQVPHHGSETSSTAGLLERAAPRYAVISAADPAEGTNRTYCHPRKSTVARLTEQLGEPTATLRVFGGDRCRGTTPADWEDVPASARLYATSRDGDVVLTTRGDGTFSRQQPAVVR